MRNLKIEFLSMTGRIITLQRSLYSLTLANKMYEFLQADERNVVVVHWNAGKGRTGTSIAWFLVYCGLANNATEAINYYGWKRFSTGKGVTQPWQLRYIHYFEAAYRRKVLWSVPKILECIILTTIPKINQNGWKPYVDILNGDYKCIYSTKNSKFAEV